MDGLRINPCDIQVNGKRNGIEKKNQSAAIFGSGLFFSSSNVILLSIFAPDEVSPGLDTLGSCGILLVVSALPILVAPAGISECRNGLSERDLRIGRPLAKLSRRSSSLSSCDRKLTLSSGLLSGLNLLRSSAEEDLMIFTGFSVISSCPCSAGFHPLALRAHCSALVVASGALARRTWPLDFA